MKHLSWSDSYITTMRLTYSITLPRDQTAGREGTETISEIDERINKSHPGKTKQSMTLKNWWKEEENVIRPLESEKKERGTERQTDREDEERRGVCTRLLYPWGRSALISSSVYFVGFKSILGDDDQQWWSAAWSVDSILACYTTEREKEGTSCAYMMLLALDQSRESREMRWSQWL